MGERLLDVLSSKAQLWTIADADRQWFVRHPERRHCARYAMPVERRAYGADHDLVLLIRFLGRDRLVYQPVRLPAPPPADERTVARLFARAVADRRPIPNLALVEPLARLPTRGLIRAAR